jgi:hypothetical protein
MSWTRALAYVGVWLVLTAYYAVSHRGGEAPPARVAVSTPAEEPSGHLGIRGEDVVGLVVESGSRRVRATLVGGQWVIAEPPGGRVSSDLIAALVSAVLDALQIEVVDVGTERDVEFGLDHSTTALTFERADGTFVRLAVGGKNPARTAVYARADGSGDTILLGLNAEYYIGLVLQTSGPS